MTRLESVIEAEHTNGGADGAAMTVVGGLEAADGVSDGLHVQVWLQWAPPPPLDDGSAGCDIGIAPYIYMVLWD